MKSLPLLLATVAFATPSLAADIIYQEPPAPTPIAAPIEIMEPVATWSGLYVGAQAGVAFGNDEGDIAFDPEGDGAFDDDDFDVFDSEDNAGFVGGVHIGYDQQFGNVVLGAIADINYIDAETNRAYSYDFDGDAFGAGSFSVNEEIDYLGTVRARAGFAFDNLLLYGTGGLSYVGYDREMGYPDTASGAFAGYRFEEDEEDVDFGYNIGAGVDYLITDNLSFGVEYLYHNLGENEYSIDAFGPDDASFDDDFTVESDGDDVDFHTVWARASYRFN